MKLTLIITTYNWPDSLALVLKSVENQTICPYEVIIADDGSNIETKAVVNSFSRDSDVNIIHSWQNDYGFRAARSRNNAILKSSGDYIVLIDGDMILHSNFIQDHIDSAESGHFVQGSRVLLSEKQTKKNLTHKNIKFSFLSPGLINRKNAIHSRFLSRVFLNKNKYISGVRSCNMAFYLNDCLNINGFNNDFEGWGREDSEFVVRLINSGVKRKDLRFCAIQYHLWHDENNRSSLKKNDAILDAAIKNSIQYCKNGINSIKNYES
ncbi:glycosyltransferase family 2 protein [Candidatus Thioglobus sp.]|nr:glycosyltransferase family 2 protein [Candidatus Thioglobus sp.]